jgi:hypothetical protein
MCLARALLRSLPTGLLPAPFDVLEPVLFEALEPASFAALEPVLFEALEPAPFDALEPALLEVLALPLLGRLSRRAARRALASFRARTPVG